MKKTLALILSIVMAISMMPFSVFAYDGTVKDIEFTPDKQLSAYFKSGGYVGTDENEQQYYFYNYLRYGEGDKLVIIDNDDNRYTYVADFDEAEQEYYLVSEDGNDRIKYSGEGNEIARIDEQDHPGKHLELGENNNTFFVEFRGKRTAVPVYIVSNPVDSFEFTPAKPYQVIENTNGHWDHSETYGDYFNYDIPSFQEGDVISVIFAGETEPVEYTYKVVDGNYDFYDENDEIIPYDDTITRSNGGAPWTIGGNNELVVEYSGIEVSVSISVIKNTVTGIDYTRAQPDEYFEGDTHYDPWDNAYLYSHPNFYEGDVLTVYEDELTTVYTCKFNNENGEYYFESENGKTIETNGENAVSFYDNQLTAPWVIGNNNEFYVQYMGYTKALKVTVKENPVLSISYSCAKPVELYANTNGYEENGYYVYHYGSFNVGDKLSVTNSKLVTTEYNAVFNDETHEIEFVAGNGDVIQTHELNVYDNQSDNHWVIGTENEYYLSYMGRQCTLYATVKANPVESIEYTRAQPAVLYDNEGWETDDGTKMYSEPHLLYGDTLVVTYTNNSKKTFTYEYSEELNCDVFTSDDGEALDDVRTKSDQLLTPWTVGGDNEYYVEYMGKTSQPIKVTIKENNLKEIRVEKVKPATVYEGDQHEEYSWTVDRTYMAYSIPWFEEGDKLILTDKEDNEKEYVYTLGENDDDGYFACGDEMLGDMLMVYHFQFMNPWEPDGEYNYFYAELRGFTCTVPVTVIASDIKSISFTLAKPDELVFDEYENDKGEWREKDEGSWYFYAWFFADFRESTLTVTYKDNSTAVYVVKFDSDETGVYFENVKDENDKLYQSDVDLFDRQLEENWTPDTRNALYMKYKGVTCEIPVTINHVYTQSTVAPTCTAQGYTLTKCSACGKEAKSNFTNALGHKWDAGKVTKKATANAAGNFRYTCATCNAVKNEIIAKNNFKATAKKKTVTADAKKKTTIKAKKAYVIANNKGKITYKKAKGISGIKVSANGNIVIKKGLAPKTYTIKIKITDKGNSKYASVTKTVTIKIKVKK
ncbi:MAG: hypothetical protein K6C14_05345 [Eubacterium sp.]|nr:hypothetical protein [Eubacterium sp.]